MAMNADNLSRRQLNYEPYRRRMLEEGSTYQDFVVDICWKNGLVIANYSSRLYQQTVGESRTRCEIKYDKKYSTTLNLYIETAEKARPRAGDYVPSGVFRDDNTWLYIIGDYDTVFIFPKAYLQCLARTERYRAVEINLGTSRGFLLPQADAMKFAVAILRPQKAQEVAKCMANNLAEIGKRLHRIAMRDPDQLSLFQEAES